MKKTIIAAAGAVLAVPFLACGVQMPRAHADAQCHWTQLTAEEYCLKAEHPGWIDGCAWASGWAWVKCMTGLGPTTAPNCGNDHYFNQDARCNIN
jgi:hypothetical protein